ncbi:MAG: hypothetical protein JSV52_01485 [Candidatus Zixiibacteriota bacterium]|nr:MAG: hypothetical protein JSV52_01485 [candidate division Zixibacteria bacterium]
MRRFQLVFLIFFALVALLPTQTRAQAGDLSLISDLDSLLATLGVAETGADENLIDLVVTPDVSVAGVATAYRIDFKIEQFTYDLIKNGGLKFAFPEGFDLSLIQVIEISDNYEPLELEVERFSIDGQLLTIHLQQIHQDDIIFSDDLTYIDVVLNISNIGNPVVAGDYQIAAVAFKQSNAIIAGPTFSEPFSIESSNLQSIVVSPSADTTLIAGDDLTFAAEGFDAFGNEIVDLVFSWSLDCGDCIGTLNGSTLLATTPGQARVQATVGDITGTSGLITVLTGALDRMDLVIDPTQFVGHPFRGSGSIALYDAFDNPVIDYSLSQEPISLVSSIGSLSPDVLADDALLSDNIVQLLPAGIVYNGLSGAVNIRAENAQILSNPVLVSFNGYDILDALDNTGETISSVYADGWSITNLVNVVIHRQGDVAPSGFVRVRTRFLSHPQSVELGFEANQLNYGVDTVESTLPAIEHPSSTDTILVVVEAEFEFDGTTYGTVDSSLFPVTVVSLDAFSFVPGSFKPDSIIEEIPFPISFDVFSQGFALPIDSASVTVRLLDAPAPYGTTLATLYNGPAAPTLVGVGTVRFEDLIGVLPQSVVEINDYYFVDATPTMFSGATVLTVEEFLVDSLYVLRRPQLSVDPATLIPTTVSAGSIVSFRFSLFADSEIPLDFVSEGSSFTVIGAGFSTSTSLNLPGSRINPGINEFTTEGVFIPQSQLGSALNTAAEIRYSIPGVSGEFSLETDFDQISITVTALPAIKVIAVEAIAPNAPKVNTGQQFQISAVVGNVSPTPVSALGVLAASDGSSEFDPAPIFVNLGAFETTEVVWDVTAADLPNPAEIFVISVEHSGIILLPPDDNVALVTIQTPADLDLTYSVFGAENGLIDYGNDLSLTVELVNYGSAEVASTEYILAAEGFDLDGPDTLRGGVSVDKHIDFSFVAPQRDTTLTLSFTLTAVPVDQNSGARALIGDTSFSVSVTVISAEASLFIEVSQLGTSLILPGTQKDIFQLDLMNTGISSATTFQINGLTLVVKDSQGRPLQAAEVFEIGNTAFYEGGLRISTEEVLDSALVFTFDNFIVEPQAERTIVLKAEFRTSTVPAIILEMPRDGLDAKFIYPPNSGMSPEVASNVEEGESLLTEALTVTSANFEGSFMIQNNPYNPEDLDSERATARFAYVLMEDANIEFRIFTLTGEEVYSADYAAGSEEGMGNPDDPNEIEWNGRNNDGRIVMNGVYIALIKNVDSGETATVKIAVVK